MRNYQAPKDLLENQVILITGAGEGIGRAAAHAFAAHGAALILVGRTASKLEDLAQELNTQGFASPLVCTLDLETAQEQDYFDLAERIQQRWGRLDGLLHNASILGDMTSLEHYPMATWNSVMQINLNAPLHMTQALLPLLKKSDSASLLFTSSSVGRKARGNWGAYSVSKFGVEAVMQILTQELEHTAIRVNSINPGATRTKMRASAYPNEDPQSLTRPESLMPIYLYLMGRDSSHLTGQAVDAQPKK
ncbi:MAG: YciK family oxidoreductase [Gammaproteobacteria bacterium]|nr:MAG: YciK family oxidoreductase [Gammaproteobacteria bacterium]